MASKQTIPIPTSGKIAIPGRENEYFEPRDLASTPGGTIFGVTPRGTRILYNREALLSLHNSPMARTPPPKMLRIPGITTNTTSTQTSHSHQEPVTKQKPMEVGGSDLMFNMDDN